VLFVCEAEGILHDEAGVMMLARRCKGDLRKAINRVQELSEAGVNERTAGALDSDDRVRRVYQACRAGRAFEELRLAGMALCMDERDLVRAMFECVMADATLTEPEKCRIVSCFVDADRSLYFAANREIVIAGLLMDVRPR
jgi:DNA polymerase III delta prime subunit